MKCLNPFSSENEYRQPPARKHHRKSTSISSIGSRLSGIFKGPPERQSKSQDREEQPTAYRHVPTHASSSFMQTTTTTGMVERDPVLMFEEPLRNDPRFDDDATLYHHSR
jgi:hypothetical protein